ncbi:MAG: hypothetical protein WB783_08320 [Arenicellales bacterium]
MGRKTAPFNKAGVGRLPNDKPAVYRIQTESGRSNYVGVAKRGRVQERLAEHLPGGKDYVPGSRVRIEQMKSTEQARQTEARVIARSKPKYNDRGK